MICSKPAGPARRATVLALLAVVLIVLILFVGYLLDIGYICCVKAQLQDIADGSAIAGTSQLLDRNELTGSPDQSTELNNARNEAVLVSSQNQAGGISISLDPNTSNSTGGDVVIGYLGNPNLNRNPLTFNSGIPPTAFSPPLLYLPSIVSLNLPFITPPTTTTTYRSLNSAQITARRDNQGNGTLPLLFGGITGWNNIAVTATATATYEDNIRGFQIFPNGPSTSKLLPFAMDVNTFGAMAAGLSSIDLYKYNPNLPVPPNTYASRVSFADLSIPTLLANSSSALSILLNPSLYNFNPNQLQAPLNPALTALLPGDGIKESLLVPLVIPDISLNLLGIQIPLLNLGQPVSVGNFGTIYIGSTTGSDATFLRQVTYGPDQADFAAMGGSFMLGSDGTLVVPGNTGLTATIKTLLLSIKGQPRVIPLYQSVSSPGLLSGILGGGNNINYTIVGFGGIVILDVLDIPSINFPLLGGSTPVGIKLFIQPEFVIDATAVGGGFGLTGSNSSTSRFVYRPIALTR
jgi:Flp pilus assembly protein TadG